MAAVGLVRLAGAFDQDDPQGAKRFINSKDGYSVALPSGWQVSGHEGSLFLFNYPRDLAIGQGFLPADGAEIRLVARRPEGGTTLNVAAERWAREILRTAEKGSVSRARVKLHGGTGAADATRIAFDFVRTPGERPQRHVLYFLGYRRILLLGSVVFEKGDAHADRYEWTLGVILESLEPV